VLFTQPVYDLELAAEVLERIEAHGLDERLRIVPEIFPIVSSDLLRSLGQAPGIVVPERMREGFKAIDTNVMRWLDVTQSAAGRDMDDLRDTIFDGVRPVPGYPTLFDAEVAAALAVALGRATKPSDRGAKDAELLRGAREAVITELGFQIAARAMAALVSRISVSGFLFVARTGRELRRLVDEARRLQEGSKP
jgi:hypothetical protein